ncbi:hypothetical protein BDZ91DRAFT_797850 [Kalaharituber pfeilii]|nr:hypothetical protein BDZ91DRAFT_797850 [Kalaharituber pfeilii]
MRFLGIGRSLTPSQVTLQMPVFCSPNVSHQSSTGRWSTEFASAGPDELEHYEPPAELRAAWSETAIPMATVNPCLLLSMSLFVTATSGATAQPAGDDHLATRYEGVAYPEGRGEWADFEGKKWVEQQENGEGVDILEQLFHSLRA